ncbi:hypothetical protein BC833DRAFT_610598 [Globomyces pollinis-pini]|nr:hypothetical protein BC833DRAFT_610598 [Globomyces pollinis-pini]KAJ2991134.1 hypothetical protein HDV02_003940 [Globomyces sp. JEL0801]
MQLSIFSIATLMALYYAMPLPATQQELIDQAIQGTEKVQKLQKTVGNLDGVNDAANSLTDINTKLAQPNLDQASLDAIEQQLKDTNAKGQQVVAQRKQQAKGDLGGLLKEIGGAKKDFKQNGGAGKLAETKAALQQAAGGAQPAAGGAAKGAATAKGKKGKKGRKAKKAKTAKKQAATA